MAILFFHWNDEVIEQLAQDGVTQDEFAEVVQNPDEQGNQSIDLNANGYRGTSTGKTLSCVYEMIDADAVLPMTAYEA